MRRCLVLLAFAVLVFLPRKADAQTVTGCCYVQVGGQGTCYNARPQSFCDALKAPTSTTTFAAGQSCDQVAVCAVDGRCTEQASGSCHDVKKWQCDESYPNAPFEAGLKCGQIAASGTCCVSPPQPGNNNQVACQSGIAAPNCATPSTFYNSTCSTVESCAAQSSPVIPATATAKLPIQFTPEVPLLGFFASPFTITSNTIGEYIRAVFVGFIWIVGILATIMVIYGGIKWIAAAGDAGRINDARDMVNNAVIGLIIALTSVVLLNTISPSLTEFKGLSLTNVSPKVAQFDNQILAQAGSATRCLNTTLPSSKTTVCSQYGCKDDLNDRINAAVEDEASRATGTLRGSVGFDAVAVRAIIEIESPKRNGAPFSGPYGAGSTAYGIGQFLSGTLYEQLARVNGGLPPPCQSGSAGQPLDQACMDWLDRFERPGVLGISGMEAQIRMITRYFAQQAVAKCVDGQLTTAAVAYNQGAGGVQDYCKGEFLGDTEAQQKKAYTDGVTYASRFNQYYAKFCQGS